MVREREPQSKSAGGSGYIIIAVLIGLGAVGLSFWISNQVVTGNKELKDDIQAKMEQQLAQVKQTLDGFQTVINTSWSNVTEQLTKAQEANVKSIDEIKQILSNNQDVTKALIDESVKNFNKVAQQNFEQLNTMIREMRNEIDAKLQKIIDIYQ